MMEVRLEPIHKLLLQGLAWVAIAILAFFFHVVGFVVCAGIALYKLDQFHFVYMNTKDVPYDDDSSEFYQPVIPGTELGTDGERRLRENLSESEGRWNKRVMG
jgi:hypothetical protein